MGKALKKIGMFLLVVVAIGSYMAATNVLRNTDEAQSDATAIESEAKETSDLSVFIGAEDLINSELDDLKGTYTLSLSDGEISQLGGENTKSIVWDGGENGATVRVIGSGAGTLQTVSGGTLVLKNLTIVDETTDAGNAWEEYLSFGGKLHFENCTFTSSIYIENDAEATFVNCNFNSSISKRYSVWCADGSMNFENCKFTGTRGLKIHEFTGDDILQVSVQNCIFWQLSEKPGIAIGEFTVDPTTIVVANNTFSDCQAWDTVGSLVGVDGFYEADLPLDEFVFIDENNTVEFSAE